MTNLNTDVNSKEVEKQCEENKHKSLIITLW